MQSKHCCLLCQRPLRVCLHGHVASACDMRHRWPDVKLRLSALLSQKPFLKSLNAAATKYHQLCGCHCFVVVPTVDSVLQLSSAAQRTVKPAATEVSQLFRCCSAEPARLPAASHSYSSCSSFGKFSTPVRYSLLL